MSSNAWLDVAIGCGIGSVFFLWLAGWLLSESLRPKPQDEQRDD